LASKQKVFDQFIYLLSILANKKYQTKVSQCSMNHLLTNLSYRGRISAEYRGKIPHFYQRLVPYPLGAILNFIQVKRDVTLAVVTVPMFTLRIVYTGDFCRSNSMQFLSRSKLQPQNRTCKPGAIFTAICHRNIAGVSNLFET